VTCTLTAVPYPASDSGYQQKLPNAALVLGTTGWSQAGGAGGTGALSVETATTANPGPVRPARRILRWSQVTATANATFIVAPVVNDTIAPGLAVTASVYVRPEVARLVTVGITWRTSAGASISTVYAVATMCPQDRWTRLTIIGQVAPATAVRADLVVQVPGGLPAGAQLLMAGALVHDGAAVLPYFEPGAPTPPGEFASWNGAAGASTSNRVVRSVATWALPTQATPTLVLDYSAPRESGSVAVAVLGRADPVHTLGPLRTRAGSLDLFFTTAAAAWAAIELHTAARVMLRDDETPQMDMYYVPRTVSPTPEERTAEQRWRVQVEYTEVYATAGLF